MDSFQQINHLVLFAKPLPLNRVGQSAASSISFKLIGWKFASRQVNHLAQAIQKFVDWALLKDAKDKGSDHHNRYLWRQTFSSEEQPIILTSFRRQSLECFELLKRYAKSCTSWFGCSHGKINKQPKRDKEADHGPFKQCVCCRRRDTKHISSQLLLVWAKYSQSNHEQQPWFTGIFACWDHWTKDHHRAINQLKRRGTYPWKNSQHWRKCNWKDGKIGQNWRQNHQHHVQPQRRSFDRDTKAAI